jgi:ATP-dependent RNA helicase DeaD
MICNAGKVVKRDVGSIRIEDTETRFEISADKAVAFAERLKLPGSLERGIVIAPAGAVSEQSRQPKPKVNKNSKPPYKNPPAAEKRSPNTKYKGRKPNKPA